MNDHILLKLFDFSPIISKGRFCAWIRYPSGFGYEDPDSSPKYYRAPLLF